MLYLILDGHKDGRGKGRRREGRNAVGVYQSRVA